MLCCHPRIVSLSNFPVVQDESSNPVPVREDPQHDSQPQRAGDETEESLRNVSEMADVEAVSVTGVTRVRSWGPDPAPSTSTSTSSADNAVPGVDEDSDNTSPSSNEGDRLNPVAAETFTSPPTKKKKKVIRPAQKKIVREQPKFVKGWLKNRDFKEWLVYDKIKDRMFCRICIKHDQGGVWTSTGTDNFR